MGERYGALARTLAAVDLFLSLYIAGLLLFSHPLGFLASIIVLGIGGGIMKLIHFGFEPVYLKTYPEEGSCRKEAVGPSGRTVEESAENLARCVEEQLCGLGELPKREREEGSRIIGGLERTTTDQNRLLTPVYTSRTTQPKTDPEAERRKEEADWAEMFRAL